MRIIRIWIYNIRNYYLKLNYNLKGEFLAWMLGCTCFHWSRVSESLHEEPETFSLPASLPQWPESEGFASGAVNLGEIEVVQITKFQLIWECKLPQDRKKSVGFYKPIGVPFEYFKLGYYCQSYEKPLHGFVLAVREVVKLEPVNSSPALLEPLDYILIWSSDDGTDKVLDGCGFFWLPQPPDGYKALGFLVTNKPDKPDLDEVRCVRADLTDQCEAHRLVLNYNSNLSQLPLGVWNMRPCHRGMHGKGVATGTFFCSSHWRNGEEELNFACLKNFNPNLHSMPNLDQIHALIFHYGPTVFFHPDELYLPSSVSWFFNNGALIFKKDEPAGENVDVGGSNLPAGGTNDLQYWIDLPSDDKRRESIKHGNLESAKLYIHVKPAFGGTFTDIVFWVFCPFNGPGTLKIGLMNFALSKIGQHVGDWEHFTLRISNFTGELWCVYFSQHSGGEWVDVSDLEFIEGNKPIVYSSRNGHASFPHPGIYLQGSAKLGMGVRNDAAKSKNYVDSSTRYEIVAAEYLGDGVVSEPSWLQYMREWGPKIVYDSRTELDRIINALPHRVRNSVENVFSKLPVELYGEEGPTGPKEKNNWVGDERW